MLANRWLDTNSQETRTSLWNIIQFINTLQQIINNTLEGGFTFEASKGFIVAGFGGQ